MGYFCPFTPLTKNENKTWRYHHFTDVRKIILICYTVPEIWCVTYVIVIFHFGLFLPFYSSNSLKKENFKKKEGKKPQKTTTTTTTTTWRYHYFTQAYQKSWSYAILFLRYMVRDWGNSYFSFWTIFCPFSVLTAQKIKISFIKKTPGGIIILHKCTKNYDHMLYCSWDMSMMDGIIFHFRLFFALLPPTSPPI